MFRALIATALVTAPLMATGANFAPSEPGPLGATQTGAAKGQECRTAATASTTKTTSPGFTSETSTTCRFDKATNKSTCTNKYKDRFKTETTTVSVTTYAKLEDAIDETKVNPPRRRSLRTDTTAEGSKGKSTTSLVNTYDGQNRLVQEVGTSTPGTTFTTTYTRWDAAGRPAGGRSVVKGGTASVVTTVYDDAARKLTTTLESGGQRMVCEKSLDANGIEAASLCSSPLGGPPSASTTTTTGTEKICR